MCTVKRKLLQPFPYTELPGSLVGEKKGNSNLPTPSSVPRAALIPCKELDGSWLVNRAKESQ